MLKPIITHETIKAISIITLKTNVGMVILVGIAARLVVKAIPMAVIAINQKIMLFPESTIANNAIGVSTHPWAVSINAHHP